MLNIQINLEKKAKQKKETGVTLLLNFTTYYRAKEMKTVWYRPNRFRGQRNQLESLQRNLHFNSQVIFNKMPRLRKRKKAFSSNAVKTTKYPHIKE